jgi:phage shock protein PspC (stress-responsive transcriptional regulator)
MEKGISVDPKTLTIKLGKKITNVFLESKKMSKLIKNKYNKMLFGVCSGLADWLNIDATLVRLAFVIGAFLTGSLLFWIYLLLAIILPTE